MEVLTEKKYKAAAYARLSIAESKDGGESLSITNQKDYIKKYCEENNIELFDFYVDDGFSGGNFDRPAFKRMINDLECGLINCVITKDTSRLGRDFIETGNYIYKYFPDHDIRYIAILDDFDTENPNGSDDIIPFKTVVNHMFLRDTSRKITSVRHDLMKAGLYVGSSVPYGYKRSEEDNRRLIIDEYAANIVKRIFNMKIDGVKPNMIARALTNEGILPPNVYNGRKIDKTVTTNLWKASSINHILKNEVYIGTLIQGKYATINGEKKKKKLLPKSKWVIKKNNHEPIIDKNIFEKVNYKSPNANKDDTRFRKYDYLLKGLVVCADCGKTMLVRRCKTKTKDNKEKINAIYCCRTYATYRNNVCSMHYYKEESLNDLVIKRIRNILIKYSNNEKLSSQYDLDLSQCDFLDTYKKQLDNAQLKLKDIEKAISELYVDKVKGIITEEDLVSIKRNLEIEREEINKKISDLNVMISNTKTNLTDEKLKKKLINNFLKAKVFSKQMMKDMINKITIDEKKNVEIYFKFNINGDRV